MEASTKERHIYRSAVMVCIFLGAVILLADCLLTEYDDVKFTFTKPEYFNSNWTFLRDNQTDTVIDLPVKRDFVTGEVVNLINTLPADLSDNSELFFRIAHKAARVYVNNELVYSFGNDKFFLIGNTPNSAWLEIPLNSSMAGQEIRIEFTIVDGSYSRSINNIFIAPINTAFYYVLLERLPNLIICAVSCLFGVLLLFAGITLRRYGISRSLVRLGLLAIFMSIWQIFGTKALQVFFGNMNFVLNGEFYVFLVVSPLFLWFFLSLPQFSKSKVIHVLFWFSIALFVIIQFLAITGIAYYMTTMYVVHAYIFISVLYIFIYSLLLIIRGEKKRAYSLPLVAISVFLLSASIDIIHFYLPSFDSDETFYAKIGFLIFLILWSYNLLTEATLVCKEAAQAEVYRRLAYEDYMTKLRNRTAFEKQLDLINFYRKETTIIIFDLNNLKTINDEYGHSKGDQILIYVAGILKDTFESEGVGYRIGGDEMCILTTSPINHVLLFKIKSLHEKIEQCTNELGISISIAVGYARTDFADDVDTTTTFNEADRAMYQCKKQMKQKLS